MSRLGTRPPRGQAMVEYTMILATVVSGLAVASRVGMSQAFVQRLADSQTNYNVVIPENLDDLLDTVKKDRVNKELTLH